MLARSRAQNNRGVDDVSGTSHTAELAGGPRSQIIEGDHVARVRRQEAGEIGLTTAVPPGLSNRSSRSGQRLTPLAGSAD